MFLGSTVSKKRFFGAKLAASRAYFVNPYVRDEMELAGRLYPPEHLQNMTLRTVLELTDIRSD